jgi:uncharacterized membrane protein YdfJ with MMPL/SSD domain
MAYASVITVVLTMATALTLLPALLGFIGPRPQPPRAAAAGRARPSGVHASGFWARCAGFVSRRPVILAVAALVAFFQRVWGADPPGLSAPGPAEASLPVIVRAVLSGLSMDCQAPFTLHIFPAGLRS